MSRHTYLNSELLRSRPSRISGSMGEWDSWIERLTRYERDILYPGMHRDLIPAYEKIMGGMEGEYEDHAGSTRSAAPTQFAAKAQNSTTPFSSTPANIAAPTGTAAKPHPVPPGPGQPDALQPLREVMAPFNVLTPALSARTTMPPARSLGLLSPGVMVPEKGAGHPQLKTSEVSTPSAQYSQRGLYPSGIAGGGATSMDDLRNGGMLSPEQKRQAAAAIKDRALKALYEEVVQVILDFHEVWKTSTPEEQQTILQDLSLAAAGFIPVVGDLVTLGQDLESLLSPENRTLPNILLIVFSAVPGLGAAGDAMKFWRKFKRISKRKKTRHKGNKAQTGKHKPDDRQTAASGDGWDNYEPNPYDPGTGPYSGTDLSPATRKVLNKYGWNILLGSFQEVMTQMVKQELAKFLPGFPAADDPNWFRKALASGAINGYSSSLEGETAFLRKFIVDLVNQGWKTFLAEGNNKERIVIILGFDFTLQFIEMAFSSAAILAIDNYFSRAPSTFSSRALERQAKIVVPMAIAEFLKLIARYRP